MAGIPERLWLRQRRGPIWEGKEEAIVFPKEQTMTHSIDDLHRIELEARRLRAEAVRDMFAALVRRVSGLFAHKGVHRTA